MFSKYTHSLAKCTKQVSKQTLGLLSQRVFASTTPTYNPVNFVKEDLEKVIQEVPEFRYYILGDEDPKKNIYASIPLDTPIIPKEEYPEYKAVDSDIKFSKLENGLKIASMDRGGLTSTLGLFVNAGSRHEDVSNFGVSHMIETMAYHSTGHLSWLRTIKTVETLGAKAVCNSGREHIVYSAECLRKYMPIMIPIVTGNVLFPRLLPWEIKENAPKLRSAAEKIEKSPDAYITELLHTTAWYNNTLGNKIHATEKSMSLFNPETIREFMLNYFSPDNMVFVGVNVDHQELCKWLMRAFVDYEAIPSKKRTPKLPAYTGGDCRVESPSPISHLAIGYETPGGWNSKDLVTLTVLQSLLGGGGSFSTGGPGKGMHTRLFLNVLNRYQWVETCMAFNTQYTDTGLFGLYITGSPDQGEGMVAVLSDQFARMEKVTKEELARAKAALKSSIWMNLESKAIVMEDVARQILMSGNVVDGKEFCSLVDSVTEADISRVVKGFLRRSPTVVGYGDLQTMPHFDKIAAALKKNIK